MRTYLFCSRLERWPPESQQYSREAAEREEAEEGQRGIPAPAAIIADRRGPKGNGARIQKEVRHSKHTREEETHQVDGVGLVHLVPLIPHVCL